MIRQPYVAYSPADHTRVTLGIRETFVTPDSDVPDVSVRFTITAPRLNQTNAPVLKTKAFDAIANGHAFLAIDLGSCFELDAAGYKALASIGYACRRAGGELDVEGANEDLRELFETIGVAPLFTIKHPEVTV